MMYPNFGGIMPDENLEAHYHFTLSAMVELIDTYGYYNVINDLDAMIADRLNNLIEMQVTE